MIRIYSVIFSLAIGAFLFSGCASNCSKEDSVKCPVGDRVSKSDKETSYLRANGSDKFSKVHYSKTYYNKNTINKSLELIGMKVSANGTLGDNSSFIEKMEDKFIKKNEKFGIYLQSSIKDSVIEKFVDQGRDVKMSKKFVLLDTWIYNFDEKNDLKLDLGFVKSNFKNIIAFWYDEHSNDIQAGFPQRLIIVVGGDELFNVNQSKGTTSLNFNTQRKINPDKNIK